MWKFGWLALQAEGGSRWFDLSGSGGYRRWRLSIGRIEGFVLLFEERRLVMARRVEFGEFTNVNRGRESTKFWFFQIGQNRSVFKVTRSKARDAHVVKLFRRFLNKKQTVVTIFLPAIHSELSPILQLKNSLPILQLKKTLADSSTQELSPDSSTQEHSRRFFYSRTLSRFFNSRTRRFFSSSTRFRRFEKWIRKMFGNPFGMHVPVFPFCHLCPHWSITSHKAMWKVVVLLPLHKLYVPSFQWLDVWFCHGSCLRILPAMKYLRT